jgi:hypothetical protein
MVQLLKTIRKTVCELNTCMLVVFEEMRKSKLISRLLSFVFILRIRIRNTGASSSPFR